MRCKENRSNSPPQWKAENEDTAAAAAAEQSRRNGVQRRQVVQLNISILIKHDKWFHADA